jgi:hypothetical protein
MPLPKAILWQFWLYCFRFTSIILHIIFSLLEGTNILVLILICSTGILALNDLALCVIFFIHGLTTIDLRQCRLAWDVHFGGSVFSTVGFQTITSLLFLAFLSFDLALIFGSGMFIVIPFNILAIVASVITFGFTARAWYRGSGRTWKLGVKEISHKNHGTSRFTQYPLSLFGTRRRPDDSIRKVWPEARALFRSAFVRGLKRLRTSMKLIIIRKTMYVERYNILIIII